MSIWVEIESWLPYFTLGAFELHDEGLPLGLLALRLLLGLLLHVLTLGLWRLLFGLL